MRLRWPSMRGSRMLQELHVPFDVVGQLWGHMQASRILGQRRLTCSCLSFRACEFAMLQRGRCRQGCYSP